MLISVRNLRPVLEGQIQDMGLAATLSMVGGKEGILKIDSTFEGRIFIKLRKIVTAIYGQKTDIEALIEMDLLKKGTFGFFAKELAFDGPMNLEISKLAQTLEQFRDERDNKRFT
jgi:hypothetical protein